MSVCYFLAEQYEKSADRATQSLDIKKSIKAYYRRAKAYGSLKHYDKAVEDLKCAIRMDTSDPNDF